MVNRQKLIGIVASVILAAVGTALLVAYVRSAEDRALKGEEPASVLVVTEPIPRGTKAEAIAAKVRSETVPAKVVAKGAVSELGALADKVTAIELLPGEQVLQSRFSAAGATEQAGVPPGSLKVTVVLDAVRVLGGQLRQGDSVGVIVSFDDPSTTHMIVQKVPVTDVRTDAGVPVTSAATEAGPAGRLLVTLAVDASSAERVVFAAEHGRIWLANEPQQANQSGTKLQTRADLSL